MVEEPGTAPNQRLWFVAAGVATLVAVVAIAIPLTRKDTSPTRLESSTATTGATTTTAAVDATTNSSVIKTPSATSAAPPPSIKSACQNSFDPSCGPFSWSPAPTNAPLELSLSFEPANPRAGQQVNFLLAVEDPDAQFEGCGYPKVVYGDGEDNVMEQGFSCSRRAYQKCRVAYGPWTPPAAAPRGRYLRKIGWTYERAGTYSVRIEMRSQTHPLVFGESPDPGDAKGTCLEPYSSIGSVTTTVTVSE